VVVGHPAWNPWEGMGTENGVALEMEAGVGGPLVLEKGAWVKVRTWVKVRGRVVMEKGVGMGLKAQQMVEVSDGAWD